MSDAELENFIQKFKQLRKAGLTAHLDLDTHAGQAWVGLKVMLNSAEQRETSLAFDFAPKSVDFAPKISHQIRPISHQILGRFRT